ncbi:hypothetical protein [Kitasatospora sp. NPDC096204]|uniref:hypothetical protein n=1 Tax=Kitasatospora sp. NPDC096204 TaxID=3364094 RepID=UPI0037FF4A25
MSVITKTHKPDRAPHRRTPTADPLADRATADSVPDRVGILREWSPVRPSGSRLVLTPEELGVVPLPPEDRARRARLLARVREENHPWR